MTLLTALSLLAVMLVLAAVPSASVALVVTRSATLGFANGAAVVAGIVLGDILFVSLAVLGMSFLADTMGSFFIVLKLCGGVYLIWLGISLLRTNKNIKVQTTDSSGLSLFASCAAGFLLTLGDIKAIVFYASLFPSFVDMASLAVNDVILIMMVTIAAVGIVKLIYAYAAKNIAQRFQNRATQKLARSTAGFVMLGTGTYLVIEA